MSARVSAPFMKEISTRRDEHGSGAEDRGMDLIIAATALTHNLILVTDNEKHFGYVPELQVENRAT
jgi:predicted nucleic acid-binding protein